ncbi:hypothetical protein ACFVT8_16365 [Lysinibacillus sp. NPDC058147]
MPHTLNKDNNKIAVFCEEVLELESAKLPDEYSLMFLIKTTSLHPYWM